ncbi:MAG: uroporphyrinogen decarboxylase family protein [Eubacteriales bacterium]|nr:uroporphyrinogen decarboxylase family protein [Eubacteriales bacterium]
MTQKERFISALKRQPITGLVPHFELVFFLTMEAFGKVHPTHRNYHQWNQMSKEEQKLHIADIAGLYVDTAKKYGHSAIFVHSDPSDYEQTAPVLERIREISGDEYFVMMHGDPTFAIPDGNSMMEFTERLYEEPEALKSEAAKRVEDSISYAKNFLGKGILDGFALCSDYCFNVNPFFGPELFDEFIKPYLRDVIKEYREEGYYVIKHTDGNIMPILDSIVDCEPHAIHSLDPQGGVDLGNVRDLVGDKVCLIGNVNCGLLQTGSREECIADVRRSLTDGMKAPGYIFSTSNCVYTGLKLSRYELMLDVWKEYGNYR